GGRVGGRPARRSSPPARRSPPMTGEGEPIVALVYDDDAYVEAGGAAPGLMGRQVAGRSFLDAYLGHGTFAELAALVHNRAAARPLVRTWRDHAATRTGLRTLRIIERDAF